MPPAVAIAGAAVVGGVSSAIAGSKAAKAQKNAAANAVAEQRRQYDQTRADFAPWRETGSSALARLAQEYGLNGQAPQSSFTTSPGYEFRREEGLRAIDRANSARGLLNSGAADKARMRYAEGLGAQEYDAYWNRLAGLAGVGQAATGSTAAAGANAANNISSAYQQMGNAQAAGYANTASSFNSGMSGVLQAYLMTQKGGF